MSTDRWWLLSEWHNAWLVADADGRRQLRRQLAVDHPALVTEADALTAASVGLSGFLEVPALALVGRDLAEDDPPLSEGTMVGRYRIGSLIARGGMGDVYRATDDRLERDVALKMMHADSTDPRRVERFLQEARVTASLDHPNIVRLYDTGDFRRRPYLITELLTGETLRAAIERGPLTASAAYRITAEVATGLAAAHAVGLVHRDLKPENIFLARSGVTKILDFGIAKLAANEPAGGRWSTRTGILLGTTGYLAPEQVTGDSVDGRTDLFALGSILFEMLTGQRAFVRAHTIDALHAIVHESPPDLLQRQAGLPSGLIVIVMRLLEKAPADRFQSAADVAAIVRSAQELTPAPSSAAVRTRWRRPTLFRTTTPRPRRRREGAQPHGIEAHWRAAVLGLLLLMIAGAAGGFYLRHARRSWAAAALTQVEQLSAQEEFFAAYDLALSIERYVPNDPTLARLAQTITDDLSIITDPPGAQVYLKRFADQSGRVPARAMIGLTPITHFRIARGSYVVTLEKDGYAALDRPVSGVMMRLSGLLVPSPPVRLNAKLLRSPEVPTRMTFVPAGEYRLVGWSRPSQARVRLDDFFIDKYEVTNREYQEFIRAGGYRRRELWPHTFVREQRVLTWEEALRAFTDRTGLSGPRRWTNQDYPEGMGEHPVTDISWYEAAAYAAFRDKDLPTVFQWEKAARDGKTLSAGVVMPWGLFSGTAERRANFSGRGTLAVTSLEFGVSPYGCYHMAGNVAEWCRNPFAAGFATTGGSWADEPYFFGRYGDYPGFFGSDRLGFRCVLNLPGATGDQGATPLAVETDVPVYTPVGEARFRTLKEHYQYAASPLNPAILQESHTDDWRRQTIAFTGTNGERVLAYLYLPTRHPPPWQLIQFVPADDVFLGLTALSVRVEATLAPFLKSGRAVLAVALNGFPERGWPATHIPPRRETAEYRDEIVNWVTDERRGLDYVATRGDLDASRVAYIGWSVDGGLKLGLPAIDHRYRSIVLTGAALYPSDTRLFPEINPINFVPHIRAPILLLQGRYDEDSHLKTQAEPLHGLLHEPKRILFYDGGHIPAPEFYVPAINRWLDETLGPVTIQ